MILADTSVWIRHLNKDPGLLEPLILAEEVLVHPFVIGELACGGLADRGRVMKDLHDLPHSTVVREPDALSFLERNRLMNTGLNYIDVHLLAAAAAAEMPLWTFDRQLRAAALALDLAADAFLAELEIPPPAGHPL